MLTLCWWFNGAELWSELAVFVEQNYLGKAAIYALAYGSGVAAIVTTLLVRSRAWRVLAQALIFIGFGTEVTYLHLGFGSLGYDEVLTLAQNVGFGYSTDVLSFYVGSILLGVGVGISVVLLLSLVARALRFNRLPNAWALGLLLPCVLTYAILTNSNGVRTSYPAPIKLPVLSAYVGFQSGYAGPRDPVSVAPTHSPTVDHIVWIVDESIRADALQINGLDHETTPFLTSVPEHLLNLGTASSAAVCSNYSHHALMSGLRPEQVPDLESVSLRQPTLSQYAQAAGFTSALLYNPAAERAAYGFATEDDLNHIDIQVYLKGRQSDAPDYTLDANSVPVLDSIVRHSTQSFTYLLKYGAHFNYEDAYPPSASVFSPTLEGSDWTFSDRVGMLNSYYNAVRFTVDDFFAAVAKTFYGQRILFVYTSDHGQNIMDEPSLRMTHCYKGAAPRVMANVPLFFFSPDTSLINELRARVPSVNRNSASHFDLFPTALSLFGYDPVWVRRTYGPSLFDKLGGKQRVYFSGDLFGRSQVYRNVF